jgi:signal transduction protein with GAF and PtsI domain
MEQRTQRSSAEPRNQLYYRQNFFHIFREIMQEISSTKRSMKVVDLMVRHLANAMGVRGSALMLLDRRRKVLDLVSSYGLRDRYLRKGRVLADKSIKEGLGGMPVCVDDVANDPRIQYPEEAAREGIRSILSVPILFKNRVIGVLRVYTSVPTEFNSEDVDFVQGVADLAGLVIEYNRLVLGAKHSLEALKRHRKAA